MKSTHWSTNQLSLQNGNKYFLNDRSHIFTFSSIYWYLWDWLVFLIFWYLSTEKNSFNNKLESTANPDQIFSTVKPMFLLTKQAIVVRPVEIEVLFMCPDYILWIWVVKDHMHPLASSFFVAFMQPLFNTSSTLDLLTKMSWIDYFSPCRIWFLACAISSIPLEIFIFLLTHFHVVINIKSPQNVLENRNKLRLSWLFQWDLGRIHFLLMHTCQHRKFFRVIIAEKSQKVWRSLFPSAMG